MTPLELHSKVTKTMKLRGSLAALSMLVACAPAPSGAQVSDPSFATLIERLSEAGGYFDTDNLISNEAAYLQVMGALDRERVRGGAYVGVGPEQNFSYIARIKPEVAYIIDLRRDNMLLHLMFKAIFSEATTRGEYLALLFGRPPPPGDVTRRGSSLSHIVAWIDTVPPSEGSRAGAVERVQRRIGTFGVPLSTQDLERTRGFHRTFIASGLDLRFTSAGRGPPPFYPTYRQLALERDRSGHQAGFLAEDSTYGLVREMQLEDRIIPVVGDLAGSHALAAIGNDIRSKGLTVSAIYVSNVEFYLLGDGTFDRYAETLRQMPRDDRSVLIRSWFQRGRIHPHAVPGYLNTQVLQTFDTFVRGSVAGYQSYWDLATHEPILPRF